MSVIISLICSVAAPNGTVFASPDTTEAESAEPPPQDGMVVEQSSPPSDNSVAPESNAAPTESPAPTSLAMSPTVVPPAPTITTQPSPIVPTGPVVVSAFQFRQEQGFDFVELRNIDDAYTDMSELTIHLLYSTTSTDYECVIKPHGYMRPNSYITYVQPALITANPGAYAMSGCPQPTAGLLFDKEIQVYRDDQLVESVRIAESDMNGQPVQEWERKGFTATYFKGILNNDFKVSGRAAYTSGLYEPPQAPSLQFLEIFPHPLACSSSSLTATCKPYIKVKNTGTTTIDLSEFRLRNGAITARSSSYNTSSLIGVIAPGSFAVINSDASGGILTINDEDGASWLEDKYGVRTYSNNDTPYANAELTTQIGRSWAYDSAAGLWKWALPSPQTEQNFFPEEDDAGKGGTSSELKPCRDDQYRSEETNRCRNISSSSGLVPCKEGQYRSEETNRCRSIASAAASVLKPCADDQFRNPATNRCKSIASSDDVADCGEGRERNPVTNRCRNVVQSDVPAAAFAVQPIKDSATAFVGWWALGGVATVALGYAGWEWRREISVILQKASTFLRFKS